jgi:hypothetical protein
MLFLLFFSVPLSFSVLASFIFMFFVSASSKQKKRDYISSYYYLFFLIKCKYCIDQKGAGDQQYKEKDRRPLTKTKSRQGCWEQKATGTDSLELPIRMPSLKKRKPKEQTPLDNQKAMGTYSLEQAKQS